ncbi:FMN-dependent NADH-azoreductase [Alcaligenes endophyticus]|uniref:FMN dependent NADH:quinone oxidoreductase n=1 Tax=Alcaligenes endophyticus TaxID=1929088 RepID=A0ABT8EI17_9BURK|nr:FMN-dependent NADH-azoreductase [Alcaligenes endophyticus]MCX5592736.1 FMN-dependent NADH-azoreductase [Alcaligenes endophyticus]MDN4120924.1 FMN-dependent NADH-azoreductase [Alcaligenes endophyticus]
MNILHIDSSINGTNSVSRELSRFAVEQLIKQHPGAHAEHLDLISNPPPYYTSDSLGLRLGLEDAALTSAQRTENQLTQTLLDQYLKADTVVIGAPFYNFTIPSQLKSWLDRVIQPRKTFQYGANGPEGLSGDKTVYVILSRGGIYSTSEQGQALEHQESYLRVVFGFIGVTNIHFIYAEGIGMGAEARAEALSTAEQQIIQLLQTVELA